MSVDGSGTWVAVMDELYAVGWRSGGPAAAVGLVGVPVAGSGGSRGARLCGVATAADGGGGVYGTRVVSVGDGTLEAVLGHRLAEGLETRRQG